MELDELEVGHPGSGPQGEGHAVAGRDVGVGGRVEDLPETAGREHDRAGTHGADAVAAALAEDVQRDAGGPTAGDARGCGPEQIEHEGVLDDLDAARAATENRGAVGLDGCEQRPRHLQPGRVAAGVRDAVAVVAALPGQREAAVGPAVEGGAEGGELPHPLRALGDQRPDGGLVADTDPGDQGVDEVLLGVVVRSERRGDPALRPPGGTGVEHGLGDQDDVPSRRTQVQRGREAGDTRADDHDVGQHRPTRRGGPQPQRQPDVVGHRAAIGRRRCGRRDGGRGR